MNNFLSTFLVSNSGFYFSSVDGEMEWIICEREVFSDG